MSEKRVVVAMSGGVDSSVAAAFLKEKGYNVIGITIRMWGDRNRCCAPKDVEDAKKVAGILGIPHYVISMHDAFKKQVVDYFIAEYLLGRTPNPCAVCNPAIKFGDLLHKAFELKADYLATGHYATVSIDRQNNRYLLKRSKEKGKDQSYFLARLSQKTLKSVMFPIGNFPKEKIRRLAGRFHLPVASKTESQEVCFIPDGDLISFIKQYSTPSSLEGPIENQKGEVIGKHQGIFGYTIGQRKGLGIALGKPVYVTQINAKTNTIIVGENEDLYKSCLSATDTNWLSIPGIKETTRFKVRIRYKHKPAWARVTQKANNTTEIEFEEPQRALTPGQLAVFYMDDIVAGSAWIDRVYN